MSAYRMEVAARLGLIPRELSFQVSVGRSAWNQPRCTAPSLRRVGSPIERLRLRIKCNLHEIKAFDIESPVAVIGGRFEDDNGLRRDGMVFPLAMRLAA